ncbi:MAG: hypothetical protein ACIAS6_01205 [Phycisphaerales bacterium JB060]
MIAKPSKLWLPISSVTIAAGALLVAGLVASMPKTSAAGALTAKAIAEMLEPELHDVDRELRVVGLRPEALAAAGLTAAETTALTTRAVAHLDGPTYTSLQQAAEAHSLAKARMKRLQRAFRAGTQGEATRQDLDDAIAAEAAARATLEAHRDDLYDAATDGVSGEALTRLARIQAEADLPYAAYLKVADRTHAQRIALRDALNGVRIDTKLGQEPSAHHQAVIDAQMADPVIAAAKTSSDTHLDSIIDAWKLVLDPV